MISEAKNNGMNYEQPRISISEMMKYAVCYVWRRIIGHVYRDLPYHGVMRQRIH